MNITSIIILYNSKIKDSNTIESILNSNINGINLHTIIWNNGPTKLSFEEQQNYLDKFDKYNIQLSIYEDVRNISLSQIYNSFIDREKYDFFSIFDQDSVLESDFFQNIKMSRDFDVIIPLIYSAGWRTKESSICFPVDIKTNRILQNEIFSLGEIESISSGLTLSYRLITHLKNIQGYVFNAQYAFYAIDTSFFLDLKKLASLDCKGICIGKINHSLDFNLSDPEKVSPSRKLEMEYANVLNKIFYKNKTTVSVFFYLFRKFVRKEYSLPVFIKLTKCLVTKKHPRSKNRIMIN